MRAVLAVAILAALTSPAGARRSPAGVVVCNGAAACTILIPPPAWLGKRGHWPGWR